jgi:alkyldihydroxyacetonephosphate synthase
MLHPLQRSYLENELVDIVGRANVFTEEEDRRIYAVDYFWVPRMYVDRGKVPPIPDFVVLPGSPDEVSRIVKLANIYRIPVIPWGGGSGSQGGTTPVYGGITLDLKRMNRLIEINRDAQTVTAEAGINGYELESALNRAGFTLGHQVRQNGGYRDVRGGGTAGRRSGAHPAGSHPRIGTGDSAAVRRG